MKIYLAAKYARREELLPLAETMTSFGHECTSTWLTGETEISTANAEMDLRDVARADALLFFSEERDVGYMTGGRHVEFGYAVALRKQMAVVGCRENIFHMLKGVTHFESFEEAMLSIETASRPLVPYSDVCADVLAELHRAERHGASFASLHEAYAVILEELDEVWDITKQKRKNRSESELLKELVQVAAMAIKAIESMGNFVGGTV